MKHTVFIISIFLSFSGMAQRVQDTIWVEGNCDRCKDRIESALDVKGVWVAEWEKSSQELYVVYKPSQISKAEIGKLLNDVGHDNEISKQEKRICHKGLGDQCKHSKANTEPEKQD